MLLTFFTYFEYVQGIAEALGKAGAVYKYDFSLAPKYFYKIVEDLRDRLGESTSFVVWATSGFSLILLHFLMLGKLLIGFLAFQDLLQWWSPTVT